MADLVIDKKDQIHRVACRLFREQGFHGASIRDIAEEVGLVGGSLYAHIESKDDVLWEIVDAAAERFFAALGPIVEANLAIVQKLRKAIVAHVEVIAGDLDAAAVYTVEWRHLAAQRRTAFTKRRDEYEAMFRRLVREAMQQGFIATADEAMATRFILSSLNYLFTWYKPDGRMTPEEVGRMMADYILDGLKRRTA
jgi:TetR/AcrR family transcriptional regulator, cholesterol catabolism regulator